MSIVLLDIGPDLMLLLCNFLIKIKTLLGHVTNFVKFVKKMYSLARRILVAVSVTLLN